jgi:hypothetical protein
MYNKWQAQTLKHPFSMVEMFHIPIAVRYFLWVHTQSIYVDDLPPP